MVNTFERLVLRMLWMLLFVAVTGKYWGEYIAQLRKEILDYLHETGNAAQAGHFPIIRDYSNDGRTQDEGASEP